LPRWPIGDESKPQKKTLCVKIMDEDPLIRYLDVCYGSG
jgi:hypothetical protein